MINLQHSPFPPALVHILCTPHSLSADMAWAKAISSHLWHKKLESLLGIWHKMYLAPSDIHKARIQSLFSAGFVSLRHKATQTACPNQKASVSCSLTPHTQARELLQAHSLPAVPSHWQSHWASGLTLRAQTCSCCPAQSKQLGGISTKERSSFVPHTRASFHCCPHTTVFQGKRSLHHIEFWKFPSTSQGKKKPKTSVCQNKTWAPEGLWVSLNACFRHIYKQHPTGPFQCRQCQISPLSSLRRYTVNKQPHLAPGDYMIGAVPISWSALWFSLLFTRPFNFSSASLFSFQMHTEMKHLKSKEHIWRLLSCRTVLTMGTMCILADSKRTSAPWWRFHITWKIIHCPAASVSCFLLSAMDAKTTTAERYTHGLAWSVPSSSIGNCTAYMQDLWLKILSSCCFLVCFAKKKKKNPTSIFIGIFSN